MHMKIQLNLLWCLVILLLSFQGSSQSVNPNNNVMMAQTTVNPSITRASLGLSSVEFQNSQSFENLKSNDRLSVFKLLMHLITIKSPANSISQSTTIGTHTTTLSELIALLGTPDKKIQQTMLQYNLTSSDGGCFVLFGINSKGEVLYYTLKNCN